MGYGIGRIANRLLGVEPFQATLLGLSAIFVFVLLADRVIHALTPLSSVENDFEYEYDEAGEELEDYEIIEDEEELDKRYAGIPRWRRPIRNLDFSNIKADDRCPCGSGRKYKNCHGAKKAGI